MQNVQLGVNKNHTIPIPTGVPREQDSEGAKQVMNSVEETLSKTPFDYQGARVISGQEEGAFGWITVNYLQENFLKVGHHTESHSLCFFMN